MIRFILSFLFLTLLTGCHFFPGKNTSVLPEEFLGYWHSYKDFSRDITQDDAGSLIIPSILSDKVTYDSDGKETWDRKERIHIVKTEEDIIYALGESIPNYSLQEYKDPLKNPAFFNYLEISFERYKNQPSITNKNHYLKKIIIRFRPCNEKIEKENSKIFESRNYQRIFELCTPQNRKMLSMRIYHDTY